MRNKQGAILNQFLPLPRLAVSRASWWPVHHQPPCQHPWWISSPYWTLCTTVSWTHLTIQNKKVQIRSTLAWNLIIWVKIILVNSQDYKRSHVHVDNLIAIVFVSDIISSHIISRQSQLWLHVWGSGGCTMSPCNVCALVAETKSCNTARDSALRSWLHSLVDVMYLPSDRASQSKVRRYNRMGCLWLDI